MNEHIMTKVSGRDKMQVQCNFTEAQYQNTRYINFYFPNSMFKVNSKPLLANLNVKGFKYQKGVNQHTEF